MTEIDFDIGKIFRLARLRMPDTGAGEAAFDLSSFDSILEFSGAIANADLSGITDTENTDFFMLRDDITHSSIERELLLRNVPDSGFSGSGFFTATDAGGAL